MLKKESMRTEKENVLKTKEKKKQVNRVSYRLSVIWKKKKKKSVDYDNAGKFRFFLTSLSLNVIH